MSVNVNILNQDDLQITNKRLHKEEILENVKRTKYNENINYNLSPNLRKDPLCDVAIPILRSKNKRKCIKIDENNNKKQRIDDFNDYDSEYEYLLLFPMINYSTPFV